MKGNNRGDGRARKIIKSIIKTPKDVITSLHKTCGNTVSDSISGERESRLARLYLLSCELESWNTALSVRPENALFEIAQREYIVALLNLCQGQYRNAFRGLRLVLELYLQGIYLSVDLIGLHEWLASAHDTKWAAIVDDDDGVFSARFCDAFFPELSDKVDNFRTQSRALYRELSECTHGNRSTAIPLPTSLTFDEPTFGLWIDKAEKTKLLINFTLAMRYLKTIASEDRAQLEDFLLEDLGHISAIRAFLGGPAT